MNVENNPLQIFSYVGLDNSGTGKSDVNEAAPDDPFKPIYVSHNKQIDLLNARHHDHSDNFDYPDFYGDLDDEAKKEFDSLKETIIRIKADKDAHKTGPTDSKSKKRLITSSPLKLKTFFNETPDDFSLENYLSNFNIGLSRSFLDNANLARANLTHANLTSANLAHANLAHANLTHANLTHANLTRAKLTGANLAHADLADADLTDANLNWANLTWAKLTRANLVGADLTGADLTDADLADADLTGADLADADLADAEFNLETKMDEDTKLNEIKIGNGIYNGNKFLKTEEEVRVFFKQLGASDENICFAQAA